ncbi:hypothetical protein I6A84_38515 [Frankia sp. CNm7]|uniref:Uncharacterized protein n=1 Tax=Frankia nepalensis TaxID=1836974 RepID=A0A937RDA1_9ACTN|nr:hypothetical protein [Frankia nepalensis]MBL7495800.1 hypothetical protein [Frankia nepalensis]MBL7513266.1 hypothetical protein [Frankia nepalensis]MBL7523782.1 hypothetical protein [Frankia nepalensis]MBL7628147.1 hypothetical protein [Frankia nepalensis]
MSTQANTLDRLVVSYLDSVDRALTGVPEVHRAELLSDLSDHIAAERAALDVPNEAALRAILDRLGDPATLAAEARLIDGGPATPPISQPVAERSGRRRPGRPVWILVGLGLALLIVMVFGFAVVSTSGESAPAPSSTAPPLPPPPR